MKKIDYRNFPTNNTAKGQPTESISTTYRIYLRKEKTWVQVDKEYYATYTKEMNRDRMRNVMRGECNCPKSKWWMCDRDCQTCPYFNRKNHISLDQPAVGEEGEEVSLMMTLVDESSPSPEEIVIKRDQSERLYQAISQLSEEDQLLVRMIMDNKEQKEIACALGLKGQSSVAKRKQRILGTLRLILSE